MDMVMIGLPFLDQGYDVWFSNSRGAVYSNTNVRDGEWSLKERWDFSWATMGRYDLPAIIDEIIELTGHEKVTYIGYSQGTAQMYYALATNQDFFAEKLNRFVALASCIFIDVEVLGLDRNYE